MRVALVLAAALALACGDLVPPPDPMPAPEPAPAETVAPSAVEGPATRAFEIVVTPDPAAREELVRRGERIVVDVQIYDDASDEGTTRSHTVELPGEGGTVSVPPISTAPGKLGGPLRYASVNLYTARRSSELNLIDCDYYGPEVSEIAARVEISCRLL